MDAVKTVTSRYREYHFPKVRITVSIQHPLHIFEAAKAGSQVATIPASALSQMSHHPWMDIELQQYLNDWAHFQSEKK